jgi:hypothetical protein
MYNALIQTDLPVDNTKKIWKMKIQLKTIFFVWYLHWAIILTKDNLIKQNWHGSKIYVFCPQDETIKHLFFNAILPVLYGQSSAVSGLYLPASVANIFRNWIHDIDQKYKILLRVEVIALIWSLWLCRNDKVFNDKKNPLLQVIYRCIGTLRLWSPLQCMEFHDLLREMCTHLEDTARDLSHGMDDSIIFGLALHHLKHFTISHLCNLSLFLFNFLDTSLWRLCAY